MKDPIIISVEALLSTKNLTIPAYQRPYKWSLKNVNQLIDDILFFKEKEAYRLGTLVIHDDNSFLNIVDGQQRTITLFLIALALVNEYPKDYLDSNKQLQENLDSFMKLKFDSRITQFNIQNNYREILRRIHEFDNDSINFFLKKCELVRVVLEDISEAFQFFDSQNARGKDLEPHDLLKAFHLREMPNASSEEKKLYVNQWENTDSEELSTVFGNYLFRIRNWSKSRSARKFTKNDIDLFKGISLDSLDTYPYAKLHRISHFYVEQYNKHHHRQIDNQQILYPFQFDQVIVNGQRFFEMIDYYKNVVEKMDEFSNKHQLINKGAKEILKLINEYDGRNRTGDKYVRNLFNCALIYYVDKFGYRDFDRVVEKFFIWAYSLRLNLHAVQIASMDNYALENIQIFKLIRESISPKEVLNIKLDVLSKNNSSKTGRIEDKFKELGYFNG